MKTALHTPVADLLSASLESGSRIRLQVTSDSMHPVLQVGDRIIVLVTPADGTRRGDLLLVRREQDFVTHRLVGRNGDAWLIKSDRHNQADPPVSASQIIGRVVEIEHAASRKQLEHWPWQTCNRLLGWCGWIELKAVKYGRIASLPVRLFAGLLRWCHS